MHIFALLIFLTTIFISGSAIAQHHDHSHHDHSGPLANAPIGVMGDHEHKKGEFMLSYRRSTMFMKGNRAGTDDISPAEILAGGDMVVPLEMTGTMDMFGAMYGVTNELTAMVMAPYIRKAMDHRTMGGVEFETDTRGFGDIKLTGLYTLYNQGSDKVLVNAGFSVPTGSITETDTTPAGNIRLPYPMQLGSGTIDPILAVTYVGHDHDNWAWGAQANAMPRFGKNDEGYRLGDEYGATTWVARKINNYIGGSLRLDAKSWGKISGRDSDLSGPTIPTARTDLRGGERLDGFVGLNFTTPQFEGHSLATELGFPLYQRLDGPQLETDYRFIVGWRKSF